MLIAPYPAAAANRAAAIRFQAPQIGRAESLAALARHVIGKRAFDFRERFLPDVLSRVDRLQFLFEHEKALQSQIQARTYLRMFNALELAACSRALHSCRAVAFGNRSALDALGQFTDRKLGHRAIFECVEHMISTGLPAGQEFTVPPVMTHLVANASTWAVLAMVCHLGACAERHHLDSDSPYAEHASIFADAMRFHRPGRADETSVEAMEWRRAHARMTGAQRHVAVNEFAKMLESLDAVVQAQAIADADHFIRTAGREFEPDQRGRLTAEMRSAYRWQYVSSGVRSPRFRKLLDSMVSRQQQERIHIALPPQDA